MMHSKAIRSMPQPQEHLSTILQFPSTKIATNCAQNDSVHRIIHRNPKTSMWEFYLTRRQAGRVFPLRIWQL